ncbi:MAG: hypothetical protein LBO74_02335 [Candidatus Symbiothrix sp.]|jgi:predicted transcriptional regulator|nr:hypothetical protein [Candidatus Symbiothrix sp.]
MQHLSIDGILNEIMLLSDNERQHLYARMQKEFSQGKEIVAYTTLGKPLTRAQYIEKIDRAIAQADRGELLTDDELQKEIETW